MTIADHTMKEIERKAKAGIAMDKPTYDKIAAYNSFNPNNTFYNTQITSTPKQTTNNQQQQNPVQGWQGLGNNNTPTFSINPPNNQSDNGFGQGGNYTSPVQPQGQQGSMGQGNYIPTYNPGAYIDNSYLDQARSMHYGFNKNELYDGYAGGYLRGDSWLDEDTLNEVAYYLQERDKVSPLLHKYRQEEVSKGFGLSDDWANNYEDLVEAQKRSYAIDDFLAHKFNINGMNDRTSADVSLSRDALGFNESGSAESIDERRVQDRLVSMGYNAQEAYNMAAGRNGQTKHVLVDGEIVDTGERSVDNLYRHLSHGEFFNDPRNKDREFNWMNYIDPSALEGMRDNHYSDIDYYYNTNFAREHGYINDDWDYNARSPWDWENMSHEDMVAQYGLGGSKWGGSGAAVDAYRNLLEQIASGSYSPSTGGGGGGGTSAPSKPNNAKVNEEQKALAEAIQRYLEGGGSL